MKADIDELYAIFLLKKNMWPYIIKTILVYPPIAAPKTLKEWKVAITSVRQEYEFIEGRYNYKTEIEIIYGRWGLPMDMGKSKNNFKDRKPKYFNCKTYGHMAKNYWKLKKEKDNRKCYKCKWVGYIAKNCKTG